MGCKDEVYLFLVFGGSKRNVFCFFVLKTGILYSVYNLFGGLGVFVRDFFGSFKRKVFGVSMCLKDVLKFFSKVFARRLFWGLVFERRLF